MSSTKSANADLLTSPHPSTISSSMFRLRRTPSELATAISRTAQIREDAAALRFELKLRSDGMFGSDNVALVSCHGDMFKGFRYSFHVSGAADTPSSQPDKDTPNEDALTFAATMNDVFRDNEEELTKAAQHTVNTLGKPLKKGEKSPHARNAAVSIAALLESYYVAAADIVGQNRKWKFRATENEICNIESDATEGSHVQEDTTPSLILPVELHPALDRREFKSFYRKFNKMDTPFSTFPVTWSGETTSFTLVEGDEDAEMKNNASKVKRRSELDRKRHAAKESEESAGGSSIGAHAQTSVTEDRSSDAESQEPPAKRSRSGSRSRSLAESGTGQDQQSVHIPPISLPYPASGQGQFLAPPGSYASHPPSIDGSLMLDPQSWQGIHWDATASLAAIHRQGGDGFQQDYAQISGPLPLSSASYGQNLGQQLASSDFSDVTLNLQGLTAEDNAALDAVAALMGLQTDNPQSTALQPNPTERLSSSNIAFSDAEHTIPSGPHGGHQTSDGRQSSYPTRSSNPYSDHQ